MSPRWLWLSPKYVSNIIGYIYWQITFRYTYVYMLNILASYIMKVTSKGFFLQRPDVILQKKQPLFFPEYLIHMNVSSGYIFVATI